LVSVDEPDAAVRRFFEEVWNRGNVAAADAFLGQDFVSHNSLDLELLGPDGYGRGVLAFRSAFPDFHTTLEDVIAVGDRVVVRGTDRGSHLGEFMGCPPTGQPVTTTWIEIFRMQDGKAVEGWVETDMKRFLDQISGATATLGQPPAADPG
jgi:predicted ester cyclase